MALPNLHKFRIRIEAVDADGDPVYTAENSVLADQIVLSKARDILGSYCDKTLITLFKAIGDKL